MATTYAAKKTLSTNGALSVIATTGWSKGTVSEIGARLATVNPRSEVARNPHFALSGGTRNPLSGFARAALNPQINVNKIALHIDAIQWVCRPNSNKEPDPDHRFLSFAFKKVWRLVLQRFPGGTKTNTSSFLANQDLDNRD